MTNPTASPAPVGAPAETLEREIEFMEANAEKHRARIDEGDIYAPRSLLCDYLESHARALRAALSGSPAEQPEPVAWGVERLYSPARGAVVHVVSDRQMAEDLADAIGGSDYVRIVPLYRRSASQMEEK